jgi:hypothetical protein
LNREAAPFGGGWVTFCGGDFGSWEVCAAYSFEKGKALSGNPTARPEVRRSH